MDDKYYMSLALEQAKKAAKIGEVPVGAVLVREDKVISAAFNRREIDKNALAHAEIIAINEACEKLGGWRLFGSTLYVTLEPCPMCTGAIINSRIDRVVYGASDKKSGCLGSVTNFNEFPFNHKINVTKGICEDESINLLKEFFGNLRQNKLNKK